MTKKEKLATEYLALKKEFDGDNFKPGLTDNQMWYLTKEFRVIDLEDKIEAVKKALNEKNRKALVEKYFTTPEGQKYKADIETQIQKSCEEYKKIHADFETWISDEVNRMVPGGWGVHLSLGYKSGNVEIGLLNRDTDEKAKWRKLQFGHEFEIMFDLCNWGKKSPRFDLNYGTLGAFDLFENETRPLFLNGLATIANNKEWLQLLMAKFTEVVQKVNAISSKRDELDNMLKNPKID